MILALIILIWNVGRIPSAFSNNGPNFEADYYAEIQRSQYALQNIFCDVETMNVYHQAAVCQDLFQRFQFRLVWGVHLNKQAFAKLNDPREACSEQKITWKMLGFQFVWSPMLLTCFGLHIPIRTDHQQDDYYESFFLTSGSSPMQMYVFKRTITATAQEVVLLSKYNLNVDPRSTMLMFNAEDLAKEAILNTMETRNFDIAEIEMIYILDIRQRTDGFEHPMHDMETARVITVCLSVFHEISDLHYGAIIDTEAMFATDEIIKSRSVTFQFETGFTPNGQLVYSCPAKHVSGNKFYNMAVRDLFYMSPGRRPNSIFAYKLIGAPDFVKMIFYVENFDFKNLRPSHPSETQDRTSNQSNQLTIMDVSSS